MFSGFSWRLKGGIITRRVMIGIFLVLLGTAAVWLLAWRGPTGSTAPAPRPVFGGTYLLIPIEGVIGTDFTASNMQEYLDLASALKPAVVVLDLDTPGGAVPEAEKIVDLMIQRKDLRFVAVVRKALSAGAAIVLACREIYVTDVATIGATTSYRLGRDGLPMALPEDLAEKSQSAWRAVCRKAADSGNHPSLLAEAMADPDFALTMTKQGEHVLMERDGKGEVLKAKGRILTLTAKEALACELAAGTFADMPGLGERLGFPGWRPAESTLPGQLRLDLGNKVTMNLVLIPSGKFLMGSPAGEKGRSEDEGPQHEVTISKPFHMGVYTVTQGQWKAIMGTTLAQQRDKANKDWPLYGEGDDHPMYYVSWDEAVEFCKKLSQKTGKTVSLPTEAQWEYACRAGSKTRFSFGDDDDKLSDYAWYTKNSDTKTHPVGQKKPNDFGLYDMHGNVWQWCADWYDKDYYANANKSDPQGPGSGSFRVLRGGGWVIDPQYCRSAFRDWFSPSGRHRSFVGFRVSVDLK